MKRNVSLSLKLALIVVSLSALIIFSLTYIDLRAQVSFFEKNYSEKAVALAKSLDASITFHNISKDTAQLQGYIVNVSRQNTEILQLSINVPDSNGLAVLASSDDTLIGSSAGQYNTVAYEKNAIVYIPLHRENSHRITVIMPVNLSGQLEGTYEMLWSMDRAYAAFDVEMRMFIAVAVVSLFILIFSVLYLLRRAIVKPIIVFRRAAKVIGDGNLDEKVAITSRDELGQLAAAFNQMTTDLKNSRAQIEQYNAMLEGLLDQKDQFISQLGHDLKNPLIPLVNLLPLIAEQEKDPTVKEHLQIIVQNAEYMRDLVIKTLQLAKLRSPNIQFTIESLDLCDIVKIILDNQQFFLRENNITIDNRIPEYLIVNADKLQLTELFTNLLTNAVKYTPKTGGVITLESYQDVGFITVAIKDTGIGMTEEQVARVFDEFYKVDKTRRELDSSGLGLTICKRIVEKHGGKIWAESSGLGKGSTFFFTLPSSDKKYIKDLDDIRLGESYG